MAVCDKWVALKIVEFLACVACLVAKRISTDDEARLALLLQKLSREWSLLTSVTWDSAGGAFADAVYGGYVIITFGLLIARVFQEIPRGRRLLEGFFLGIGLLLFLILGGLELASLDSVPKNLTVNASVLGSLSLLVAALFLVDLMGPRVYTAARHSQTDTGAALVSHNTEKRPEPSAVPEATDGRVSNGKQNGHIPAERPKTLDLEKSRTEKASDAKPPTTDELDRGYTKFADGLEKDILETSKFGSLRNDMEGGNYVRLSDPLFEPSDKLHYEQELAKFNEKYFREYLDSYDGGARLAVKENYLPELQTPVFSKVKTGRLKSLYDDVSPAYDQKRLSKSPTRAKTVATPTLQQLEDYLRSSSRSRRADTPALFPMEPIEEKDKEGQDRASGTPTDPGYVQYTAGKWPNKREIRTPRHSPTQ